LQPTYFIIFAQTEFDHVVLSSQCCFFRVVTNLRGIAAPSLSVAVPGQHAYILRQEYIFFGCRDFIVFPLQHEK